jgi:hypothetical protein
MVMLLLYYKIRVLSSLKGGNSVKNKKAMKKTAFISDILFAFIVAFVPALCFLRYLRLSIPLSLILASLLGIAASGCVWAILRKKRSKLFLKKRDEEEKQKWLRHLMLSGKEETLKYFFSSFKKMSSSDKKLVPLQITAFEGLECMETEGAFVFIFFSFAPLDCDAAARVIRLDLPKEKLVLCGKIAEEAKELFRQFSVPVWTENEVFLSLKEQNCLPESYLGNFEKEKTIKSKTRIWFAKSNSRRFFWGGALLLLTSLLTPFPAYYLIFGSLMILSAIFIRIFGYR